MRVRWRASLLTAAVCCGAAAAPAAAVKPISKPRWVSKFLITEYYPAPEKWFVGRRDTMPGLSRKGRVDWLYSATGLSMEGDGVGTDGKRYHIDNLGKGGWIAANGKKASFGVGGDVAPAWRQSPSWRNKSGAMTFPLEAGGWSNGKPKKTIANRGITFATGPSRDLTYLRSVASDPRLVPLGSLVYLTEYATKSDENKGWMYAEDTGGAIKGRHLDVYRRPPADKSDTGQVLRNQRVFVVPVKDVPAYLESRDGAGAAANDGLPPVPRAILMRIAFGRW